MANDFKMFDSFDNRVSLVGTLTALTALRIGAGRATGVTGTDLPVVRNAFGKPYIPGSSFKGALRASVEALVRSVSASPRAACNPLNPDDWCVKKKPPEMNEEQFNELIEKNTCLVCHVFGSPWLASKVSVRDLPVEGMWIDQYEVRNGVGIDRDAGTAAEGLLYDFEVVPAGTSFSCKLVVENAEEWELGLLMMALRPFERGEAALGGARSRGLGAVEVKWHERKRVSKGKELFDYLADQSSAADFNDEQIGVWLRKLRGRLEGLKEEVADA
jgi:CRISPR-associated RAMP protein (TIGR02581 family)